MKGFSRLLRIRTRWLGIAAAILASGSVLPGAEAKTRSANAELQPTDNATDPDATGKIRFKHGRRGDRVRVQLRNLDGKTSYDVRDAVTKSVLTTARTNRRGRAKTSFLSQKLPGGEKVGLGGLPIEICLAGTDDTVLEGQVPGDERDAKDGFVNWSEFTYRIGEVYSDPDAAVQVSLSLSSVDGADLESPIDSMSLYVGPNWWSLAEDGSPEEPAAIPGPVSFWIADGEGDLQEVASIEAYSYDYGDDDNTADGKERDGTKGKRGGLNLLLNTTGSDDPAGGYGDDGGYGYEEQQFFSWYADSTTEDGLPLGVGSLDDLAGRAFEVRDAEGTVLLAGEIPAMEEIVYDDAYEDMSYLLGSVESAPDAAVQASLVMSSYSDSSMDGTYDSISLYLGSPWMWLMEGGDAPAEISGPVTLWIADEGGDLEEIASIEADSYYYGTYGGKDGQALCFSPPVGSDGGYDYPEPSPSFSWYVDNQTEGGLPFGVDAVVELSGRAFEVRDADGNVIFSGDLPEMEELVFDDPGYGILPGEWDGYEGDGGDDANAPDGSNWLGTR